MCDASFKRNNNLHRHRIDNCRNRSKQAIRRTREEKDAPYNTGMQAMPKDGELKSPTMDEEYHTSMNRDDHAGQGKQPPGTGALNEEHQHDEQHQRTKQTANSVIQEIFKRRDPEVDEEYRTLRNQRLEDLERRWNLQQNDRAQEMFDLEYPAADEEYRTLRNQH
ncbi:hypothetical protein BU24DRAFT_429433, partial [Aaosphaeria arxii CBS 175.79]